MDRRRGRGNLRSQAGDPCDCNSAALRWGALRFMEVEQTQSFNQKLSQWIASQGFWFQLRHSISGGGGWAMTLSHLMRLGLKVLIVLVVAAGIFGIYLVRRVGSKDFVDALDGGVKAALGAEQTKIVEFSRMQGDAQIRRIGSVGGKGSFYHRLDAGNVRFKMPLLAGMTGPWEAGSLAAKMLEVQVKAGADTPAEAQDSVASLFKRWENFRFSSVDVDEATIRWGYSQRTWGKIEKSRLKAARSGDTWHLEFSGGTFSQNWLKGLEIQSLVMDCTPTGLKISKGEFKAGSGTVKFNEVQVAGGTKPALSGKVELNKIELANILPDAALPFVEGTMSGEFRLSGSTNSSEGVQFEGDVTLGNGNVISLRDRFHLVKKIAQNDRYHSYKKLDFARGTFHLKTSAGTMELSRVDIRADDMHSDGTRGDELVTLQGRLKAVIPDEVAEATPANASEVFAPAPKTPQDNGKGNPKNDLTLEKAGAAAKNTQNDSDMAIFAQFNNERSQRESDEQKLKDFSKTVKYDGGFRISIPGDAFDSSKSLRQAFPVDPGNGRIAFDVPLQGTIYELTQRQSDEMQALSEER